MKAASRLMNIHNSGRRLLVNECINPGETASTWMGGRGIAALLRHPLKIDGIWLTRFVPIFWDTNISSTLEVSGINKRRESTFDKINVLGLQQTQTRHYIINKQGKQCFQRWNRCVRFKAVRLSSLIPWDLKYADNFCFYVHAQT